MEEKEQSFGCGVSVPQIVRSRWRRALWLVPLLAVLLAPLGAKAADSPGVKFNPGVRYSQWAINSRANDFYANTTAFGLAKYNLDGSVASARKDTKKKLDYVPGIVSKSMIEASDYYESFDWSKPWFLSVKEYGEEYKAKVPETGDSFDNLNGAKLYIGLYNNKYATDADKSMVNTALSSVKKGFLAANTSYVIPSGTLAEKAGYTVAGGWWHKSIYKNQMWLDGAYMGSALLAQLTQFYGSSDNVFGSKAADWDMVTKQLDIVWNLCWNSTDKLMYHAFDATATAKAKDGSSDTWSGLSSTTPYVFHSAAYWGRADAWYLYALVDVLEAMKTDGQEGTSNYAKLKGHLDDLAAGIAARQDKTTGGWYQLLDKDASFVSTKYNGSTKNDANYIETSATSLFSAAFFKASRLGLLDNSYKEVATKAFEGLVNNFVTYDSDGTIQIWGSSKSAGLGGSSYRDGSNEYYLSGGDVTMVKKGETTEGKVLGGFIMAATEYEKANNGQQILFARDLAPEYTISSSADVLDATAYGTDADKATYQWYKDGNAVADAISATYSPAESGTYYCTATVDGKTITTSKTTVTVNSNGDNTTVLFDYTIPLSTSLTTTETKVGAYGSVSASTNVTTDGTNGFKFDGNKKYLKITLSNNTLQTGDIITLTIYTEKANNGVKASAEAEGTSVALCSNSATGVYSEAYTVKADDVIKGKSCIYLYRSGGNATYLKAIKITRASAPTAEKYAVTASVSPAEGGSVAIKNSSNEAVASGTEVEENTSLTFTATANDGYEFVNWTDANGTEVSTDNPYTATVTAAVSITANFKQKTVTPDPEPTENTTIVDFNNGIGTVTSGNTAVKVDGNNTIVFGANYKPAEGKYITITAKDNGGFKAGDVITITGTSTKGNAQLTLNTSLNSDESEQYQFSALGTEATTLSYTVQADCDVLYLGRASGSSAVVSEITVVRGTIDSDNKRLVAKFQSQSTTVLSTTATVDLPKLTVTADDAEMTDADYTVAYESDNADVATVSDGQISIHGVGTTTIVAKVTPNDATKYEGCTATYQITVKEPSPLNIQTVGVTMNTTDAEVEQPIIKVYGDDDKLLKLGTDYTLSFDVTSGSNVSVTDAGTFEVSGKAYAWTKGTTTFTVTATPTASLGDTYTVGTLSFDFAVVEGKIKPQFLQAFAQNGTIKLAKDGKKKEFTVPLLYNGGDVSTYFDFTFKVECTEGTANDYSSSANKLTFTKKNEGKYKVTVSAKPHEDSKDEDKNYADVYDAPDDLMFNLEVSADYKLPVVTTDPEKMSMYTGTTAELPDVTVTVDGNVYTGNYTQTWVSFTPGLLNVDQTRNRIEGVREGKAQIRVTISGDGLETTTAFVEVYVDDPALYRAKDTDQDGNAVKYGNQRVMSNQDNTMSVTLGGWMFPNAVTPKTGTTDEKLSNEWAWKDKAETPKWKLSDFDFWVSGEDSKNARQEDGSNAMPESTKIYDAKFNDKGSVVDKMFNVPCSGSYLVFNPKTSGQVNVHIFQNGVFDKDGTKYQYRPQRRVFVMDEAGNFVSSDAHIESTTGKPTGKNFNISEYKWDLNNTQAPTEADVVSHFTGLESFSMTAEGFKNNVYESALPNDVVPNAAADDNVKGSHGWCVLADSPVTYSFRVKPGKTYYLYNFGSKIGFYGFSFEEDETKPTVDEVVYNDNTTNEIKSTEEGHVAKVTVNRSFKAGVWNTCVLPFSLNKQQVDAIFGTTYGMTNNGNGTMTTHTDGTQILYFDRVVGSKAYFVRHAYNTIVANKPFLIKPAKDVEEINTASVTDYPYITIEAPVDGKPAEWCEGNGYAWVSSYNNMTVKKGDCFISTKDGSFKNWVGDDSTLKGFRGYLKNVGNDGVSESKTLTVAVGSNVTPDETSAVEGIFLDSDSAAADSVADGRVYNLNGQLVATSQRQFRALPSGVYMVNGKKVVK